jgi:signal transduction histidine kinase
MLGVLNLFGQSPRQPSSQEIQLLTAIAHQIGAAIENAWLAEEASEIEILRGLNRLRSELVANVSHELRTPLGLIKFFVTSLLMEDADFDWETQLKFLHGIDEEADRLEVIVNNLLDISYVESGRLRLDRRPTNMGQLVREIVASMNAEAERQPVRHLLAHDFPPEPLVAPVDVRRIEQVLRNLLHNATKYSPDGGTITVRGRGDNGQILVWVSDQGVGIPPQDLERVFERFYRVDNEITQKTRGAGLGLSVCQGIVEAHGGRIWAESVLGEGSTFYFTLPLTADETLGGLVSDREETDEEG